MAEIEINDFSLFWAIRCPMYIIKRLTVPTSGYRGLAHLAECSGHILRILAISREDDAY